MKHYILFQAYGNEGIIAECKFALLRLVAISSGENFLPEVIIYTDQPKAFSIFNEALTLHLIEINGQQIAAWKGKDNFVHRLKIEIIKDALQCYGGKMLYADTDTCCLQNLDPLYKAINNEQVVMHEKEGVLDQPTNLHFKKWNRFLQKNDVSKIGEKPAIETAMWNAGAIGLQQEHLPLLDKILFITDLLYPLFPKHTVEQFAFGYTFQNEGLTILAAKPYLFHYWNLKEFRDVLLAFFKKYKEQPFKQLLIASAALQPESILNGKLKFERQPSLVRAFKKLTGKKWTINVFMPED